jgi:hypothetical protein
MKEFFWNSRGLSDLAKTRFLRETSKEQNLAFIALLEMGNKKDFPQETLNNFSGGGNFVWHWTTPHGRSGGILLGVNLDVLDVGTIDDGDLFVKFRLRDKGSDFKLVLVAVYGAAQPEFKEAFLTELVQSFFLERRRRTALHYIKKKKKGKNSLKTRVKTQCSTHHTHSQAPRHKPPQGGFIQKPSRP